MKTPEKYNKTQLHPENCFERHVFHRDQVGHFLRWSYALRKLELGMRVLDFGCGSGNLAEVMYRNRYKGELYLGLDIRTQTIKSNQEKFKDVPWVKFEQADLVKPDFNLQKENWDLICCFEVAEHCGKQNVTQLLRNIKAQMSIETLLLISTPVYDEKVGAADNHTYDSGDGRGIAVHELTYVEFKNLLEAEFKIEQSWGVFASVKDYKHKLESYPGLPEIYQKLHGYFDSNILSNIMAPLFPEQSRNVMWECKLK